jgi:hypothetical protein
MRSYSGKDQLVRPKSQQSSRRIVGFTHHEPINDRVTSSPHPRCSVDKLGDESPIWIGEF